MINSLTNNLPYVMQSSYGAVATIVTANIFFAKLADRIARFVELQIFGNNPIPFMVPPASVVFSRTTIYVLSAGAMNIALNKLLEFPLNPWVATGLSALVIIYRKSLICLTLQIAYTKASQFISKSTI